MPKTKICFKCKKRKPITSFYKHSQMKDGVLGKCKKCTKKDVSDNYHANREYYAEYEKKRFQNPDRKAKALEYQKKRRAKNPGKYKAQTAVSNAVRDGRLLKEACENCGNIKSQAHHDDYRKPLEVRWLCRKCHLEHHGKKSYEF